MPVKNLKKKSLDNNKGADQGEFLPIIIVSFADGLARPCRLIFNKSLGSDIFSTISQTKTNLKKYISTLIPPGREPGIPHPPSTVQTIGPPLK